MQFYRGFCYIAIPIPGHNPHLSYRALLVFPIHREVLSMSVGGGQQVEGQRTLMERKSAVSRQ